MLTMTPAMRFGLRIVLLMAITVMLACLTQIATGAQTPTPEPVHERCIAATALPNIAEFVAYPDRPANEQLIADIEGGIFDGYTIDKVWVVHSDDFVNVWFVGAMMHGLDLPDQGEPALWAVGSINEDGEYTGVGLIYAVDTTAVAHSNWGDGGKTDAELSINDDGAEDAMECAAGDEFKG